MGRRNPRVDTLVRDAVAGIIENEISDPRLNFVTINEVEVTPDQKYATIWWTVLDDVVVSGDNRRTGGDDVPTVDEATAGLASAASRIRGLLGKRVKMRNVPELRFKRDPVREQAGRVEDLLRELRSQNP